MHIDKCSNYRKLDIKSKQKKRYRLRKNENNSVNMLYISYISNSKQQYQSIKLDISQIGI